MRNNKNRIILLSIVLITIIATGIFLVKKNNDKESNIVLNKELDVVKENKGNEKKETDKFYYVEEFVGESLLDGDVFDKLFKYNGEIVKYKDGYFKNIKTGENIHKIPDGIEWKGEWIINEEGFWNVKYDADSKKVIVSSFDFDGNKKESIEIKKFKGNINHDSYIQVEDMKVTNDYIYLLSSTNTQPILQIFTKTGDLKNSYENVTSFDVDNKDHCIYTTWSSESFPYSGFFMIDSETGTEIFRNTSYKLEPIRFSEDGELIYGFDEKIHIFSAKDGGFKRSIFEFGKDSTYLLDDYWFNDFIVGKDEEIYCWLETKILDEQEFKMSDIRNHYYLYTKKEGERPKRETTLTITAPYRNDFMAEAIKRYELKYPDEHIEYSYAYNTYEAFRENSKEYGDKLTLDIISGDIGDIIQTGGTGLAYHNLFRTDVFMDLTDLLQKDKNYEFLNKDVLNAIKINNAIRGLPINYLFYQYELNEELEKQLGLSIDFENISWSEVLDLVKVIEEKAPDRHLFTRLGIVDIENLWEDFGESILIANMPDLINLETKEVNLNQQWFKDLLIKFKECSKSKNFVLNDVEFSRFDKLYGSLLALTMSRDISYEGKVYEFNEYNKTNKSRMIPDFIGEKNNNRIGYSIRMYSINNRSERKENAWKYLSFLLTEDIQLIASKENTGMPISEKGVDRMIEDGISMRSMDSNTDSYKSNRERYNKAMIENSHKIDYLYNMGYLRLDISDPIGLYMEDKMTLDEALKKAEENVMIRLNE